jgi:cell wall-associated NlpC family hydrolase
MGSTGDAAKTTVPAAAVNRFKPVLLACCIPPMAISGVLLMLAGGGSSSAATVTGCGGGGAGGHVAGVTLDAEQMQNSKTIIDVTAGRHLPAFAAIVAVDTSYTEIKLRNETTQTDDDSEGLFQQRVSIYTKAVADDPVKATNAFLDRLVNVPNWQSQPVGDDAQAVQISKYPERYPENVALAQQLVGQFWAAAAAAAAGPAPAPTPSTSTSAPSSSAPSPAPRVSQAPICAGGGGAGPIVGPTGNNVAGTTTIPAGFVITGSAAGQTAVQFALKQLGKPYVFAAAGPDTWDCSGLTMGAWAAAGVTLPHFAASQAKDGTPEATNLSQAVGGDLVFIPGSDGTAQAPGHVGMVAGYVDKPDGRHLYIIQAPMTGLTVELTEATEWNGEITDVRHIK